MNSGFKKMTIVLGFICGFAAAGAPVLEGLKIRPNPFSPRDPFGAQFEFTVAWDTVGLIRYHLEVRNDEGRLVFNSHEVPLTVGFKAKPGLYRTDENKLERRGLAARYAWDGKDNQGNTCRPGRYHMLFILQSLQGVRQYSVEVLVAP